jgi:hypothetical protein
VVFTTSYTGSTDKFHLGNADENRIELVKLGWEEGFLI